MILEPPPVDIDAGMTVYTTPGGRHGGKIRTLREDFVVEELFDVGQLEVERKEGYVPVYSLKKSGLDTPHAAKELGEALRSNVNFAGLKDSNAVTTQYASARSSRAADPPQVKGKGFQADRVGYLPRPISRGMVSGNAFRVVVRTEEDLAEVVDSVFGLCRDRKVPNFYGYQRFGLRGMVNHKVGRAVLKRDFEVAVKLLLGHPREREPPGAAEARELAREGRYGDAARSFSTHQDIEKKVASYLDRRPADFLGAFRRIPIVPRRLMVQSYQAYLFNLALSRAVAEGQQISLAENGDNWAEISGDGLRIGKVRGVREPVAKGAVPLVQLVGYAFRNYGSRFDRLVLAVLDDEGIGPDAFYIKEAEEVSNEGGFRQAPLLASAMRHDGVAGGIALSFDLGRGEYATTLLREILKPGDPLASGF